MSILVIPPGDNENYKRIAQTPPEEAAAQGLGNLKAQEVRNAISGQSVINHWGGSDTALRKGMAKGVSEFAFDPRTLGISADLSTTVPLPFYLGYENCRDAKVLGSEDINGARTTHVVVDTAIGTRLDFWIEDAPGFRVHRHRWDLGKAPVSTTCDSEFVPGDTESILPYRVTVRKYAKNRREPGLTTTVTVDSIEFGPQSPPPGSLASLDLPIGTAVVDEKTGNTLGYWDGRELAKTAPRSPQPLPAPVPTRRNLWVWLAVGAAVVALVGVALGLRRRRNR